MTVRELVERLGAFDPGMRVVCNDDGLVVDPDPTVVTLETDPDFKSVQFLWHEAPEDVPYREATSTYEEAVEL